MEFNLLSEINNYNIESNMVDLPHNILEKLQNNNINPPYFFKIITQSNLESYVGVRQFTADINTIDYSTSETPAEHKSHNLLELENGQFGLYPNNRMRIYDNSLTPDKPLMPDFKVSTMEYQVENNPSLSRYGDSDDYFYKSKDEK